MTRSSSRTGTTRTPAATNARNFRTFLLMQQFEAQAIGARIRQARLEAGMTQEELAEGSSVSKRSLQDYEYGVTIPYRHLTELATILRRSVAWFLHGAEADRPPEEDAALADRMTALEAQMQELVRAVRARRVVR